MDDNEVIEPIDIEIEIPRQDLIVFLASDEGILTLTKPGCTVTLKRVD